MCVAHPDVLCAGTPITQGYHSYNNNKLPECYNCGQPGHLTKGYAQRQPENRHTQNQSSNNADRNRQQQNQNPQMNAVDTEPAFDTWEAYAGLLNA